MNAEFPRVTALVPAYNAATFIDETLQSLAKQTYPNLRVLISVDASVDDTAERCERFARRDSRFVIVQQKDRLGWVRNARELLHRAESDLCFFLSHDDLIEPEYVTTLASVLTKNRNAVLAYTDMEVFWPDGRRETLVYTELDRVKARLERGRIVLMRTGKWWITYRGLFRTAVARRGSPLRRNLAGEFAADWPFLLHFAFEGECVRVPGTLYTKRLQVSSLSACWRYRVLTWFAVDLSCCIVVLQASHSQRELSIFLVTLIRRMGADVAQLIRSIARRTLRYVQVRDN